jgi:hypothetical protein
MDFGPWYLEALCLLHSMVAQLFISTSRLMYCLYWEILKRESIEIGIDNVFR